jgi:ABC-type lipoprotein release transport system permease subunit
MASGSSAAMRRWALVDIRARWKSMVVLGLLAGVTTGLALGSVTGALDSGSALERLRERTNASDAIVFASQVGVSHPGWSRLEHQPEVASVAPWALVFGNLGGDPGGLVFTAVDDRFFQDVDRPVVVEGRMFDPRSDHEVVVAEGAAKDLHVHVGDRVPFTPYTEEDAEAAAPPDEPSGPHLDLEVVGIVRTPLEPLFVTDGFIAGPPGLIARHPDVEFHENATVRLRDPSDVGRLEADATSYVAPGAPVLDLGHAARRITASTDVERAALLLLALAITFAGLVLVGQVAMRSAARVQADAATLQAIGLERRSIAAGAAIAHLPAAVTAFASTITAALAVSNWLPLGAAARVDPNRGLHLDLALAGPGALVCALAVTVTVFVVGWLSVRQPATGSVERPGGLVEWVRRHASPPVGIGTSFALRRGRGATGLPVRSALLGAIVGVLGVAGALTLDAGLHDALAHPERAGVAWDAIIQSGNREDYTDRGVADGLVSEIRSVDGLTAAMQVDRSSLSVNDERGVPAYALRPLSRGEPGFGLVVLDGVAPTRPGEAAIGPASADALGVHIGDTIQLGDDERSVEIVGTALFPSDVHAQFDEGLWVDPADYDAAVPAAHEDIDRYIAIRVTEVTPAREHAVDAIAARHDGTVEGQQVPPELSNLRGVVPLPRLLAAFLAALALAALLHVLVTTTRVRAPDFAVLRALGLTKRGIRRIVNVQAAATFVAGLVFGIPLGLAGGRVAWSEIASRVPLAVVSPVAAVAIAVLLPLTLAVAQVVALAPARRAARLRTAEVLRAE